VLLKNGCYAGAYYLAGYAVECALKACIAKQTLRYEFPDKRRAESCWKHDLEGLLKFAGLSGDLATSIKTSPALEVNWTVVKDWSVEDRYDVAIEEIEARDLFAACTTSKTGVLWWIRQRW
jgi:hypothetical protein